MKHWQTGLVVVGLVAACLSAADPLKIKRIPLAGLTEISVLVEPISPGFEKTFDREEFQTAVELRLRRAGIKVVEPDPKASKPCLIVNLNMMRAEETPITACSIRLDFYQQALLARDPSIKNYFGTWESHGIITVGESKLREIENAMLRYVDIFANDFLAANQK